ncbi:MAG: hypothetical protein NT150_08000 [Bacteroidetes bacterium]|nr:hypothetical protein [Bacteroidota bacterium]
MKGICKIVLLILLFSSSLKAQDSSLIKRIPQDTSKMVMNSDAVYNRPFLMIGKAPIAIGGYLEANTQYMGTDGVTDGFSFQFRRLTLFFSSTIAKRIKFLSEMEFEDGTKEINLEYAAIDLEFHHLLNFRGGIIMNPIGAFNQNHDGPRWEFIDRPLSATTILPATLSNVGFGFHGKLFAHNISLAYELYLTNGFDGNIVDNSENRTSLAAGKSNVEKFEESNSGMPMFSGKMALKHRKYGELGLSTMAGVYNKWNLDGVVVDSKRSVSAFAVDFNVSAFKKTNIVGEITWVNVDLPAGILPQFGSRQMGAYMDIVHTLYQGNVLKFEKSKINACMRLEYVDYNVGTFASTQKNIGDDIFAIVPGVSFRPSAQTVLRLNYRYLSQHDFINNPPSLTSGLQFGFSTYF